MGFPTSNTPQRSTAGISTVPPGFLMADYPQPSPLSLHQVFGDFDKFAATDWATSAPGGSIAITGGNGGQLLVTTGATGTDLAAVQTQGLNFNVIPGCRIWHAFNFQVNDATACQIMCGLANNFLTLTPIDGIYFNKPAGGTVINLVLNRSGTSTVIPLTIGGVPVNLANNTAYSLGFYYDGKSTPTLDGYMSIGQATPVAFSQPYYPGGNQTLATASADPAAAFPLTNLPLPATGLTCGFAIKAAAAAAKVMTVDYFLAANEILRF
jgi:hypothetical protein